MKRLMTRILEISFFARLFIKSFLIKSRIVNFFKRKSYTIPKYQFIKEIERYLGEILTSTNIDHQEISCPFAVYDDFIKQNPVPSVVPLIHYMLSKTHDAKFAKYLTVILDTKDGPKFHHTVVYSYKTRHFGQKVAHFGNYGHFRGYTSITKIAQDISSLSNASPIGLAIITKDLKLLHYEPIKKKT